MKKKKFLNFILFSIVVLVGFLFEVKLLTGKSLDEGSKGPTLEMWHKTMGDPRH